MITIMLVVVVDDHDGSCSDDHDSCDRNDHDSDGGHDDDSLEIF